MISAGPPAYPTFTHLAVTQLGSFWEKPIMVGVKWICPMQLNIMGEKGKGKSTLSQLQITSTLKRYSAHGKTLCRYRRWCIAHIFITVSDGTAALLDWIYWIHFLIQSKCCKMRSTFIVLKSSGIIRFQGWFFFSTFMLLFAKDLQISYFTPPWPVIFECLEHN